MNETFYLFRGDFFDKKKKQIAAANIAGRSTLFHG